MKTSLILLGALAALACGGKNSTRVMTPEERLEEQLRITEQQKEQDDSNTARFKEADTVDEEAAQFDEESANHEMRRASLNAVDCPNTFEKEQLQGYQPGKAVVTMVFENAGRVKDVSVSAPYAGTNVGDCVVRAMGTVRIEMFSGPEVPKTWELELGPAKPREPAKKK
jgi:hypothetical protein